MTLSRCFILFAAAALLSGCGGADDNPVDYGPTRRSPNPTAVSCLR